MKAYASIAAFCLAAAMTPAALAQWSVDVEAGLRQDSNLNNAAADIVGDHAVTAAVAATRTTYLENDDNLSWGARAATETYGRYAGLNNLALGAFAAFGHKMGLGAFAPRLGAAWSSSRLSYSDKVWNGWLHQADFDAGKRLDARWRVAANYRLAWRSAATQPEAEPGVSGDAFSAHSQTLTLGSEYAASPAVLLSASGFVRRGDVVSFSADDDRVLAVSKAAANDNVFGADRYAYRLAGTSYGLCVGLGLALGPHSHLDFGMQRQVTYAAGGNNYAKHIASLAWIGSF